MKIFCIHTLPEAEGNKKAERMFRTLNVDEYYYLYSGYEIDKDWLDERDRNVRQVVRKKDRNVPENFFTDTIRNPRGNDVSIELCAIVGQNGAGKSSVIELLMRVINNLSAVVLGEYFYAPKSEHIHYIDNVYAEFYYENDHVIYCLGCKGDTVYRYTFSNDQELGNDIFVKDDNEDRSLVLGQNPNGRNQRYDLLLENLFYTIVSNYSLHSYLPSSYMNELTSKRKEFSIRRKGIEEKLFAFEKPHNENGGTRRYAMNDISIEDRLWLTGLFHKNDEYQTPIVITPMRNNGEIDVNNEQDLAMERMLSMLFL